MSDEPLSPMAEAACAVDGRHNLAETERGTCAACVNRVRADLNGVLDAYALLPDVIGNPLGSKAPRDSVRGNEKPMPGGDALVLAAAGGNGIRQLWSKHYGEDDHPGDPVSAPYELGRWEDAFRKVRREPAALTGYYVSTSTLYLLKVCGQVAKLPEFPDFADDIRQLRARLERVTGTANDPVYAPAPCVGCGGRLAKDYRDAPRNPATRHLGRDVWGLAEDWQCRGCRRTYTDTEYERACVAQQLHDRAQGGTA